MNYSVEEIRKCIKEKGIKSLPLEWQNQIYHFEIVNCDTFPSKNKDFYYVKFIFALENGTGNYQVEQVFSFKGEYAPSKRLDEFFSQFMYFIELNETFSLEDFVGEKGTCFIEPVNANYQTYYKIIITSLEE